MIRLFPDLDPGQLSGLAALVFTIALTLAVCAALGHVLVPRRVLSGPPMLRLAVILVSGMVFVTGVTAFLCLKAFNVMSLLALGQLLALAWWWRARRAAAEAPPAEEGWTWKEIGLVTALAAGFLVFSLQPGRWWAAEGGIMKMHEDMGFFVSLVEVLPESRAANIWAIFMGENATDASGMTNTWYHWGAMLLAVGIRAATGMPAAAALLLAGSGVINVILMIAGGALAETLLRLSAGRAALAGMAAVVSGHFIKLVPAVYAALAAALPFDVFHHLRVTLALALPYKYEGALMLLALALWQARHPRLALLALYAAACSAPQSVAVAGAACATFAGLGLVLRDRPMRDAGALATLAALAAWATMHFGFSAGLTAEKGASPVGITPLAQIPRALLHGLLDTSVTVVLSVMFIAGAVFLARRPREEDGPARLLGWLALSGVVGSTFALHLLQSGDRFHVVMLTHAALVMPVGALGLLGMTRLSGGAPRLAALAMFATVAALGVYTQLSPALSGKREPWRQADVDSLREILHGRPMGYFSNNDRVWWISKHAFLGGLLGSRCMRLNPLDERASIHYSPVTSTLPLRWLPPRGEEPASAWSLRLARKLGVSHILETPEDRLPKSLRESCKPVWQGSGGMTLYEVPEAPKTGVAQR